MQTVFRLMTSASDRVLMRKMACWLEFLHQYGESYAAIRSISRDDPMVVDSVFDLLCFCTSTDASYFAAGRNFESGAG